MRRRELFGVFLGVLGGIAATWPLPAQAQQTGVPVIGLLSSAPFATRQEQLAAFHRGLRETGFVEGQNVRLEYRSAENQVSLLPGLANDLVERRVNVIATIAGEVTIVAAKAATSTIPIVFVTGSDPVRRGLVGSLSRPGGNATGISFLVFATETKRLELLSQLIPSANNIGVLVNPDSPNAGTTMKDGQDAAQALGKSLSFAEAASEPQIDSAFDDFVRRKVQAIAVGPDPFFLAQRQKLVGLARLHKLPDIHSFREFAAIGGLMSYGSSLPTAYRQVGVYVGRILKGEKPADLPVVQSTKFEFVINLKTARALGLEFPAKLLVLADDVIE
jgi:putative ABC transport system substrate-binding protein